ncbi:hypothetical protein AWN61_05430 [Enterococcus faecium]|nr:hypothetical protein AWN61_05430 [Enterococcus faecium]
MRRGRIHLLGQRPERDAARLQIGDDRQQVRQRASEPVELPHDQCVARVQIVEAGFQAWSVVARAGCLVGMEMPMIDPGCDERVPLEIDRLAVIGR